MRRHAPLVALRDGKWVPSYPSRLYCRGRDYGWIREFLEGSIYLLISGLYKSSSKKGSWILDDYQDNRYLRPPYGYVLRDSERLYFHRGGFSIQPNLLAGLMPHLERDEPEIYIWMYFNALCACYREEIGALREHPKPEPGFSNAAQYKTSDEANSIMWLRYMLVYWNHDLLHFGRAMPRAWLAEEASVGITRVSTYHGVVDLEYAHKRGGLVLTVNLDRRAVDGGTEPEILARFRHPDKRRLRSVKVNGRRWHAFDSRKNDVVLTGLQGRIEVEAEFDIPASSSRPL